MPTMKMKRTLETKVSPKVKLRHTFLYAGAGIALATLIGFVTFFYLNVGNKEDALAASFSTAQAGAWNTGSTWVGNNVPGNWGSHDVTFNHNITGTPNQIRGFNSITGGTGRTFTSTGNLTLQSVNTFTVDGTTTINGNYSHTAAGTIRITSGDFIVSGNLSLQDVNLIIENGRLIVGGWITTSNNSSITAYSGVSSGGNISVTGGGITIQNGPLMSGGNVTLTNSALLAIAGSEDSSIGGHLSINNSSDLNYNSTGTLSVSGNLSTNGGSTKEINVNSGVLAVGGNISLASATTINVAQGATMTGNNLSTGNNADAIINVDGNLNIANDVDLGGVVNISETGTFSVGNNYTMRNSGTTATVVDGMLEVGNNLNINDKNLTGTGLLDWGTLNMTGFNAAINGQKTDIPPPILDLSNMTTFSGVLPVELLSFTATPKGSKVTIKWQTATELNNDYFTLERSTNGLDFKSIATLSGNGTTNEISNYEYVDGAPLPGLSYYRLVQTDFDGTSETFRAVSVNIQWQSENKIELFPNPLLGNTLRLKMAIPEEGQLEILSQNGGAVYSRTLKGIDNEEIMDLPGNLLAGIYIVNVRTASMQKSFKLVKK